MFIKPSKFAFPLWGLLIMLVLSGCVAAAVGTAVTQQAAQAVVQESLREVKPALPDSQALASQAAQRVLPLRPGHSLPVGVVALPGQPPSASSEKAPAPEGEVAMWRLLEGSKAPEDVQEFLKIYPNGQYAPAARLKLKQLQRLQIGHTTEIASSHISLGNTASNTNEVSAPLTPAVTAMTGAVTPNSAFTLEASHLAKEAVSQASKPMPSSTIEAASPELMNSAELKIWRQNLLEKINQARQSEGLGSLTLDEGASRVAQAHCEAQAQGTFFGHFTPEGLAPYERYYQNGVRGHVNENLYLNTSTQALPSRGNAVLHMAERAQEGFMAERAPHDAHRRTVLEAHRQRVGIGLAVAGGRFTYCSAFIADYLQMPVGPGIPLEAGKPLIWEGQVLEPQKYGLYLIAISWNPPVGQRLPVKEEAVYLDQGQEQITTLAPWEFTYEVDRGEFRINYTPPKPGVYYARFFLKEEPAQIPYLPQSGETNVSTRKGFLGGVQVFEVR